MFEKQMIGRLSRSWKLGVLSFVVFGSLYVMQAPVRFADTLSTRLSMIQAKLLVQSLLQIPQYYTLQNQSFQAQGVGHAPTYQFDYHYTSPSKQNRFISVRVNADTGEIMNFNRSSNATGFVYPLPVNSNQARKFAIQWAKKLYPKDFVQTKLLPLAPIEGALRQAVTYTYDFERIVHGIPAPFNGVSITINQNGELMNANVDWSKQAFPVSRTAISIQQANLAYAQDLGLHLAYMANWSIDLQQPRLELAYVQNRDPAGEGNGWDMQFDNQNLVDEPVIDAQNGKIIGPSGAFFTPSSPVAITPVQVGGPSQVLGSDAVHWNEQQAETYAQNALNVSAADLVDSSQNQMFPSGDVTWNFDWHTSSMMDIHATVDATVGLLTGYSAWSLQPPNHDKNSLEITQVEANQVARDFIKRIFPKDTGSLALLPMPHQKKAGATNTNFIVEQIVNQLPVEADNGYLSVNPVTGQIAAFWMGTFPHVSHLANPSQAIANTEAKEDWIAARPMQLTYLMTQPLPTPSELPLNDATNPEKAQIILAYAPMDQGGTGNILNALTGQFIANATSKPYVGSIKDLQGVSAAPQIQLLVNHELISVDANGDVHPHQVLTRAAFVKLVVDALGIGSSPVHPGIYDTQTASATDVSEQSPAFSAMETAYQLGWIQNGQLFHSNDPITRGDAAQILIHALQYGPLTNEPQIFHLAASDAHSIPKRQYAADTIAVGLGLLPLQDGKFDTTGKVTLADAAIAVIQTVSDASATSTLFNP